MNEAFGFLNIDKPLRATSHDVVASLRRGLKLKKVGHAGTLDPLATGVLVICLGGATRLSEYVMQSTKRYRARVHLGVTTDTYDAEGQIQQVRDAAHITRDAVQSSLNSFLGNIQQIPPMYSAIKQSGRKLYDLARSGETIERQPRAVRIDSLEILEWSLPEFVLDVTCSAGTYIRSLAYDLGEALGVGAHLSGLIRLASGSFTVDHAVALDTLLSDENWQHHIIPPRIALSNWPAITLSAEDIRNIRKGHSVSIENIPSGGLAFAYSVAGDLVAVIRVEDGLLRPHKVFS